MPRRSAIGIMLVAIAAAGCAAPVDRDVLYQTSTINALAEGLYDGNLPLAELLRHGDFGIGTFDALDGEMVVMDGRAYQVRADGKVYAPDPDITTPFASVTFFEPETALTLDGPFDLEELERVLDRTAPAKNIPIAIRITGTFQHVKTRSVPKQTKPYPRLVEVAKQQPTFDLKDVRGTIVGFRLPEYLQGINVPGYHLHFLAADRSGGGHVLEATLDKVRVEIDETPALYLVLPQEETFGKADLGKDRADEIRRVEK